MANYLQDHLSAQLLFKELSLRVWSQDEWPLYHMGIFSLLTLLVMKMQRPHPRTTNSENLRVEPSILFQ